MDDLAGAVTAAAGQPLTSRVGTIVSVNPIQVDMGGTILEPAVVGCASSYLPRAGDTVVLLGQSVEGGDTSGATWMIVSSVGNIATAGGGRGGDQVMASVQSEGAGVFTTITGLTFPFTKRRTGSLIHARFAGSSFASATGLGGEFTARILSGAVQVAEQVIASSFYNAALTHGGWTGFDDIPNVPAGSYTITARFRKYVGGAGNIQFDTNDRLSLYLDEV